MAVLASDFPYRIERATMRDREFGKATGLFTSWLAAVRQCLRQTALRAGAREVWAFRLEANGMNHANAYFQTSTAAIYFRQRHASGRVL
jgi:hypothetical protein